MPETTTVSPAEVLISQMIKLIERVDVPDEILEESEVNVFREGVIQRGEVVGVPQARMGVTEKRPIRTDRIDKCIAVIFRNPVNEPGIDPYVLVHVQDGNLDSNMEGARYTDLLRMVKPGAEAIIVLSQRARTNGIGLARELAYGHIKTKTIICSPSGNSLIDVAYTPDTNQLFIRTHGSEKIQRFRGF